MVVEEGSNIVTATQDCRGHFTPAEVSKGKAFNIVLVCSVGLPKICLTVPDYCSLLIRKALKPRTTIWIEDSKRLS